MRRVPSRIVCGVCGRPPARQRFLRYHGEDPNFYVIQFGHSYLRATIGSILVARRAGM